MNNFGVFLFYVICLAFSGGLIAVIVASGVKNKRADELRDRDIRRMLAAWEAMTLHGAK